MTDLSSIYVAVERGFTEPALRCKDHDEWWAGADDDLPTIIGRAVDHFRDVHRVHVPGCLCADRVTDGRCVQPIALFGTGGGGRRD